MSKPASPEVVEQILECLIAGSKPPVIDRKAMTAWADGMGDMPVVLGDVLRAIVANDFEYFATLHVKYNDPSGVTEL